MIYAFNYMHSYQQYIYNILSAPFSNCPEPSLHSGCRLELEAGFSSLPKLLRRRGRSRPLRCYVWMKELGHRM